MHLLMFLQAAAATATDAVRSVGVPSAGDINEVVPYLTSAALIMYAQRWLKHFPLYDAFVDKFPGADKWAHRVVAAVGAAVAALGIHWTFEGTLAAGGHLSATIPPLIDMLHGATDWVKVFALQQWAYESTSNRNRG